MKSTLPSDGDSALVVSVDVSMSKILVPQSKPLNDNLDLNLREINRSS